MNIDLKHLESKDWQAITSIYQQGLGTGIATFETQIPTWEKWNASHVKSCRIGAWLANKLVGWAVLSPVSNRCVYSGVAEVSVYVAIAQGGKGIGSKLLEQLIHESEAAGFWTLQSGIFPQNVASIKLHKKMGFRTIGYREKICKKDGIWMDSILMERRSKTIGI